MAFSAPRTAPVPPSPTGGIRASTDESDITEEARGRELPLPPRRAHLQMDARRRHVDQCDYCRKIHRRARSRSRSRQRLHQQGSLSSCRCSRHKEPDAGDNDELDLSDRPSVSARVSVCEQEEELPAAPTSTSQAARTASTVPRTLLPPSRGATGDSTRTSRQGSSLPPYVSNPPSDSERVELQRERVEPGRSRSSSMEAAFASKASTTTLAFIRDQQQRQRSRQGDRPDISLAAPQAVADPHRVHFVPSHAGATAGSSTRDDQPQYNAGNRLEGHRPHRFPSVQGAHDSSQSVGAQMRLTARDERISTMLDDCLRGPHATSSTFTSQNTPEPVGHYSQEHSRPTRRRKKPTGIIDSVLGFDEVTPQDLVHGEGAKVDGGFGYALPSRYREGSVLLDSEEPSRFSIESTSTVTSTLSSALTSYLRRNGSTSTTNTQDIRAREARHVAAASATAAQGSGSTDSNASAFLCHARPTSLADRVNQSNLRPRHLDLSRKARQADGRQSQTIESPGIARRGKAEDGAWEDVQLQTARPASSRKNARLADALGVEPVERPATAVIRDDARHRPSMSVINEEGEGPAGSSDDKTPNEKDYTARSSRFMSGETDPDALARRRTASLVRDSNTTLPAGMSEADIVAICLVQGMVPPGLPRDDTLVTWSGPLSPTNPRNWPAFHKWYACIFVSLATFLANAGTNMVAPALGLISDSYHEIYVPSLRGFLIGSYVFAFAFAPLLYGTMSELLGRKPVLIFGSTLFFGASHLNGQSRIS